jgi:hypothetical protein
VFEVQYLSRLLRNNQFDNTYHEHTAYFSLTPLITLLGYHDLAIFDVEETEAQGGSIRVYASHNSFLFPIASSVKRMLDKEKKEGLHKVATYKKFSQKPTVIKNDLLKLLKKLKKEGKTIAGYGASAKGNTLLQYTGVGENYIDYIIDTAPSKQGKYTPGTHVPVHGPEYLKKNTPDYLLILTWNHAASIMKRESGLAKKGVKFIIPVPRVRVVK